MVFRNTKLVGSKKSLTDQEAFIYYRDRAKKRNKKLTTEKKDYAKIINSIYKKVRRDAIEYQGGIYAPSFFYISPQPYPKKTFMKILQKGGVYKGTMNLHTESRVYTLLFVNLLPKKTARLWDMSGAYFNKIREKMTEKLKSGKANYMFVLDTLKKVR